MRPLVFITTDKLSISSNKCINYYDTVNS